MIISDAYLVIFLARTQTCAVHSQCSKLILASNLLNFPSEVMRN